MQDKFNKFQACQLISFCFIAFPVCASDLQCKHFKVDDAFDLNFVLRLNVL